MRQRSCPCLLVLLAAVPGCFEIQPPPVPDGYPALSDGDVSRAELQIDGGPYLATGSYATLDPSGFADDLHASLMLDLLDLQFRDLQAGEYTVSAGDLEVGYIPLAGSAAMADPDCGSGKLTMEGPKSYTPVTGERDELVWGDLALTLCTDEGGHSKISGRFSALVERL